MLATMLPYVTVPTLNLGPLKLQPFGVLVVTGIIIGTALARWRAPRYGIARDTLDSFVMWMLGGAFVGAHMLDAIFYHPDELAARPWSIFFLWEGLSSFGGFIGCLAGGLIWKYVRGGGKSILVIADLIMSVFPVAWIFGRAGCSIVHDHPGAVTSPSHWLAVPYPDVAPMARWDMGVLECAFAIVLSVLIAPTWFRKQRLPVGSYLAAVPLAYAPVRFLMDFLRETDAHGGDVRWFGLTFAQWCAVALFGFGVTMLVRVLRGGGRDLESPPPAEEPPAPPPSTRSKRHGKRSARTT